MGLVLMSDPLSPLRALHYAIPHRVNIVDCDEDSHDYTEEPTTGNEVCMDCPTRVQACATCVQAVSYDPEPQLAAWPCATATAIAEAEALLGEVTETVEWGMRHEVGGHRTPARRTVTRTERVGEWEVAE